MSLGRGAPGEGASWGFEEEAVGEQKTLVGATEAENSAVPGGDVGGTRNPSVPGIGIAEFWGNLVAPGDDVERIWNPCEAGIEVAEKFEDLSSRGRNLESC